MLYVARVGVAVVCAAILATAAAQTCVDVSPVDVSVPTATVGNGTAGSCTESALRTAVSAGGTVVCNCGPGAVLSITSEIAITRNTVLDGGGVTLDGGATTRFFKKGPAANQAGGISFTVQNMTMRNGLGDSTAGAIRALSFGIVKAINVTFRNNHCRVKLTPDWGGGAIHAIQQRELVLAGCTFAGNSGASGGAVGGIGNSWSIVNCVFDSNFATGTGGGADAGPTGMGGIGGAVYVDNVDINGSNNYFVVCRTVFRNSHSRAHAGAIFAYFRPGLRSTGLIDRCTFENNSEEFNQAGAIYQQNGTFTISNTTFSRNAAVGQGGAVWAVREASDSTLPIDITNCTFASNSLSGDFSMGGAVCNSGCDMRITGCTFYANTVRHFACAIKNSGRLSLSNTLLDSNLLSAGPKNNGWAGMAIDKNTRLTDLGGNLCFPATFTQWGTDEWLNQNPGVLRTNPLLLPLADNGGATRTMAIPANSSARNAGNAARCLATDQRGVARDGVCDIGAYEYNATTVTRVSAVTPASRVRARTSVRGGTVWLSAPGGVGAYDVRGRRSALNALRVEGW